MQLTDSIEPARYWWVNHGATFDHETKGGYLWSPMREKKARSQFYENMRRASPGELVISYAAGRIRLYGRIEDFAAPALKPIEFGRAGEGWGASGWILPVAWTALPYEVNPKHVWDQLKTLLPTKYSPLVMSTGNGSQKAYLSEISKDVFALICKTGGIDAAIAAEPSGTSYGTVRERIDAAVHKAILDDLTLSDTQRQTQLLARVGQGEFRNGVLRLGAFCRLTGVRDPAFLNASHILPWRVCETAGQRIDAYNGLMLTPNADRLFDRGFISFANDGRVMLSPKLSPTLVAALGFPDLGLKSVGQFDAGHHGYLDYHRRIVFLSTE